MTPEQGAAYVNAMVACATIEAMSMKAANKDADKRGVMRPYGEKNFFNLIEKYGIHHNAIHEYCFVP